MSTKKCPNCGLENVESALRCDCGYDFTSGQVEGSYLEASHGARGGTFARRAGAYVIDVLILLITNTGIALVIGIGLGIAFAVVGRELIIDEQASRGLDLIFGLILSILFYTLFEGLHGASPGKLMLGMRVILSDGRPCSLTAAFIRAILRLIDGLFLGLIAYANMKPPLQQRLGDKAANTIVVASRDPLIQAHRPWWWLLIAAAAYLFAAAVLITVGAIFALR